MTEHKCYICGGRGHGEFEEHPEEAEKRTVESLHDVGEIKEKERDRLLEEVTV